MIKRKMRLMRCIALFCVLALCVSISGCVKKTPVISNPNDLPVDYDTSRIIKFEIEMEDGSVMSGELYPLEAPITVRNFVTLAESGYYNGTQFSRIIADKIVQCFGPDEEDPYHIYGEFKDNGWRNTISHVRGTLSMSHVAEQYDSAYSSFFILLENRTYYDGDYAAFGRITDGLIVADKLSRVEVNDTTPVEPQVIKEIRILGN